MNLIKIEEDFKKRLDIFLVEYFENKYNRKKIANAIETGFFLVNDKIQKPSYKIKAEDIIKYNNSPDSLLDNVNELQGMNFKLDIKFEDDDLIVVNKPKNMLSHPTKFEREKTLVNALISHCGKNLSNLSGEDRLGIVHRLDKNTAGLMLVAKNNISHNKLSFQIKEKIARRKYLAIVLGNLSEKEGSINKPLRHSIKEDVKMTVAQDGEGIEALTNYRVIEEYKGASLVELELKTGRTHQIRVHLSSINHPVFGDDLYNAKGFMRSEFLNLKTCGQLLQSYYISFFHPKTEEQMEFKLGEKDFSPDFIKVLKFLRSKKNEY